MKVACLLPVRNGADDLKYYFESIRSFADTVVALDDGSTDSTVEMLEAEPLVEVLMKNPRRASYHGWDDSLNRRRLIAAAKAVQPDWIFWLDADEVVEPSDAAVLRQFLERDASPTTAYSVEVHRLIESMSTFDKSQMWVTRFYGYSPSITLPDARLHFDLAPLEYQSRIKTSIRLLHRAGISPERRKARFDKYKECDPSNQWQRSYKNILDEPRYVQTIQPRRPADPVVIDI